MFEPKKHIYLTVDEHCYLRILTKKDVSEKYVLWLNDYEVTKYTEQRYRQYSRVDIEDFVVEKFKSKFDLLFGIFKDNRHIGNIKLGPINWKHMSGEVSYFIGEKDYWGKGIASSVVKKVVQFAFNEVGLKKVNAGYYENNLGSAKVLQKCSFVIEGVKRSENVFEGKRINSLIVGLTENDNNSGC